MKAVILAGGLGTHISEETHLKPKPMIEIGGKPILWHIMKLYSAYGVNEFIIFCGYKGYIIKEYFANYFLHMSDITFDMESNRMEVHQRNAEPWKVTSVDTGENTLTGGRLKRVVDYDIFVKDVPIDVFLDRPCESGNNPKTTVWEFLKTHPEFAIDKQMGHKLLISVTPDGYLKS